MCNVTAKKNADNEVLQSSLCMNTDNGGVFRDSCCSLENSGTPPVEITREEDGRNCLDKIKKQVIYFRDISILLIGTPNHTRERTTVKVHLAKQAHWCVTSHRMTTTHMY
jgi:hypothetical protein